MPSHVPSQVEIFDVDVEGVGLELARLVDLETKLAEQLLAEIGIEGEIATPQHESGGSFSFVGVEAGHMVEKSASCPTIVREYLHPWQIIGATANTLQDCETLIGKEVDYIRLSPFRVATPKDSLDTVLGLNGYTVITEALKTQTPIIGAGGITTKDVKSILETGISGIAVSDEITSDFNVIRMFNKLLNASSTAEKRHTF